MEVHFEKYLLKASSADLPSPKPHYHVLLWIKDAPLIGKSPDEEVLTWIQNGILCQFPHEKISPELHHLITQYQLHKCSSYCKHKKKYGNAYAASLAFHVQ